MVISGSLIIGGSDVFCINLIQNSNNSSVICIKGENGFIIFVFVYNLFLDSYIQNYQVIVFDVVMDMGICRQVDIISYFVESGVEVSDYVQIKNNIFKLLGIIFEILVRLEKDLLYSVGVNGICIS